LHYFWDSLEGGVFWSVDWRGNPSNTQKQIYAQAFAIYAFAEYFLLTNNASVLEKAAELFWLTEKYSHDRVKGGYFSAFARDWSSMDDIRLSEKDANESKIMNTHLHLLEAYTNLYRCTNSASVRSGLEYISDIMISRFYNKNNGHLHIYFDDDWQVKGNLISFGHDIEASWLLYEAAELLGESQIIKTTPVSVHLAEATFSQGLTANGLNYEIHENGSTDTDKHWWPQTEGVVGFWNAWQLTGRLVFANASASLWGFIKNHILDKNEGEWHWRVNEKGIPALEEDKAGPWKCPYHNGRMCMEMLKRLIGS
jgi:mannobiose 2-epimerase